jgi:4-carboxymuconolactone decarboxylase
MDENPKYLAGLAVRKAVLGEEYVNRSIAGADEFMAVIQQFLTETAWGGVWTRPGLERKTRSLLNLAMLTALNRPNELKLHIRGALSNGVTREEMAEVFLQAAVYCGAPAGLDAFKLAQQVFQEETGKAAAGA